MTSIQDTEFLLMALSTLAGAVHVIAPDHWVPASILTWQRRWRPLGATSVTAALLSLHVVSAVGIYWLIRLTGLTENFTSADLLTFTVMFLGLAIFVRAFRFSRVHEVFRAGPRGIWGILAVISLLGPAESLIPILIKGHQLGIGYLIPSLAFFAGSLAVGSLLVVFGKVLWDRPLWLSQGFSLFNERKLAYPVTVSIVAGIAFILSAI